MAEIKQPTLEAVTKADEAEAEKFTKPRVEDLGVYLVSIYR